MNSNDRAYLLHMRDAAQAVSDIPWRDIIDFRNVAIHDYMDLDMQIVWNIMRDEIPDLSERLRHIQ